jgi:hypothetical protein
MFLSWIDRELTVISEDDGSVCHVFEKGDTGRSSYNYMARWVEKNWTGDFTEIWEQAKNVWDGVSPENKMALWSIDLQNEQNFNDIRHGLLATLREYQGSTHVKRIFEEAIRDLEY